MDVLMPQLGETVAEGKVTRWFKAVGDKVAPGENLCEIEEAAGADPVDALLVLLHLLERQPQMLAKLFLAHAEQHPPQSDPRADMDIHRIGAPRSTRRLFAGSVLG